MTGRELIKQILDAKAEDATITISKGEVNTAGDKLKVLLPYAVQVFERENGVPKVVLLPHNIGTINLK